MKFEDQRKRMVENQIAARGIKNPELLAAFLKVPRHLFVPEEYRNYSYQDHPLGIGQGQTISQPYIVAMTLDLLCLSKEDIVLEIGTGSGYQTALIAEMVKEVYTVERIPELLMNARIILKGMNYDNIHFRVGDGTKGWEKAYPPCSKFNKIAVSAAAPHVPESLILQLAEGGKLVIPAGNRMFQELLLVEKQGDQIIKKSYGGCTFVPLIGEEGWKND
ncbi:MAG: protein-L-isoaspartate(D-aspartate) O-methyltransferase [Candidatus Cloacimonetes bacterium]|nr:protein-L-isoaspartate(D-aspartate) O-methyltransferase [Candidatus Cloacimonadota bacterium]